MDMDTLRTTWSKYSGGRGIVPGAVMLTPTPPSLTSGGRSDLYYSPSPPPLSYRSPEMLPPVVSLFLSLAMECHYP